MATKSRPALKPSVSAPWQPLLVILFHLSTQHRDPPFVHHNSRVLLPDETLDILVSSPAFSDQRFRGDFGTRRKIRWHDDKFRQFRPDHLEVALAVAWRVEKTGEVGDLPATDPSLRECVILAIDRKNENRLAGIRQLRDGRQCRQSWIAVGPTQRIGQAAVPFERPERKCVEIRLSPA